MDIHFLNADTERKAKTKKINMYEFSNSEAKLWLQ